MHPHSHFRLIPLALPVASFPEVHATSGAGLRLSPLVFVLDPPSAKYFTLCCVFIAPASLASFQAIRSLFIIYRRLCQSHEATTSPDPSGLLFPLFLALSAVLLTITLILDATDINGVPTPPRAFLSTISMVACLADIFLASSLLALLSHRQSVTFRSTGILSKVKPTIDIFLMLTLVGLSMSSSWIIVDTPPMLRLVNKLIWAYVILLLMATLNVMISSIGLHVCMRRTALSNARDSGTMLTVSLLLIMHSLFPIIQNALMDNGTLPGTNGEWNLAGLVVGGSVKALAYLFCLPLSQ